MLEFLPGTTLPMTEEARKDAFGSLAPIFAVSGGGLLLSQVSEMTGLGSTTIQNWVKRGWVSSPVNKRYSEVQVSRILLINLLRPAMQLEKIVQLLHYLNGSVEDRADDAIPEPKLYSLLCTAMQELSECEKITHESLVTLIEPLIEGYEGPVPGAAERLKTALSIMLMNVAAAMLMQQAEAIFAQTVALEKN